MGGVHLLTREHKSQVARKDHALVPTSTISQVCNLTPCAHVVHMPPISVPCVLIWQRKNMHKNRLGVDAEDEGRAKTGSGRSGGVNDVRYARGGESSGAGADRNSRAQ